jgi:hypothetical protein
LNSFASTLLQARVTIADPREYLINKMKKIAIIIFLATFSGSVFGQYSLSKDALTYLKNEKKYNKKSRTVVENVLEKNNIKFLTTFDSCKTVPTFKVNEKYLKGNLGNMLLNLKIDERILWDETLIIRQTFGDFKSLGGFIFCESDIWNLCLYDYNPEKFEKHKSAVKKFIFGGNYDLIFKVDNYPQFWFLWKDNQLSLYSFLNETLYVDKKEMELYLKINPPILKVKHSHKPSPCHKIITVVNKSNKKIYLDESYNYVEISVAKITNNPLEGWSKVLPNEASTTATYYGGTCIEHLLYPVDEGFMTVFVFDGPTLESKGWDLVKANNLFLKRYDLTLKDLEKMNWTITYEGN